VNKILWSQNEDNYLRKITWRKEDKSPFSPEECEAIEKLRITKDEQYKDFEPFSKNWANCKGLAETLDDYTFSDIFPNNELGFEIIGSVEKKKR
jgi:hypothetical protein